MAYGHCRLSFVPPTPKKSLEKRDDGFASLLHSYKNVSNSPTVLLNSTLKRCLTVDYRLSLNANLCGTSCSVVLPFVGTCILIYHHSIFNLIIMFPTNSTDPFPTYSAAYGVLRFVMESNAKGCEVVISGKLRAARAKSMKFTEGFMIHSGQPARDFVDEAVRHVMLRQGVLGIKVKM
jgi:hypothetical protein